MKYLNKLELDHKIKTLVARERELLHEILQTIIIIESRKIYLELGFSNLFIYLTEGVGYSAGSAQRRIEAARLLKEIPEVGEKIQSGDLTLNQISLLQKTSRDVLKNTNIKVSPEEKLEILNEISKNNFQDSQQKVAAFFDLPIIENTTQKTQSDESVRISLTLSKELNAKIQQAQALLSHAVPSNELVDYLEYVTNKVIQNKTSVRKNSNAKRKISTVEVTVEEEKVSTPKAEAVAAVNTNTKAKAKANPNAYESAKSKANLELNKMDHFEVKKENLQNQKFSNRQRKIILNLNSCCQYEDPITKKKCNSHWFLQADHKISKWAGGTNDLQNGQILCAAHNQLKYKKETGIQLC